jgi:hypothetical protein
MKVPDFVDPETGVKYEDIEVVVVSEGNIRQTAALVGSVTQASARVASHSTFRQQPTVYELEG